MPPHIFASSPAVKAVVTLVLIENSQRMFNAWTDLKQNYLPTLLASVRLANPVLPIPVLWLTTAPVGDDSASIQSAPPRQYNQLPDLKFNFSPDNKLSFRIIHRAVELMLEAATQFHGGPVNLHLFVVAASPPTQGTWGVSATMPSQIGQSEWRLLGQRLAQLGIHCHMILPTSPDMASMHELFTTSLELQGNTKVTPWFPISPEYTFLLSGNPSAPDPLTIDPVDQQPHFAATRPPVVRHQSFPQDVQSAPPPPVQKDSTPRLVSSLQKVHGLSRKKLYGTQPPRQPFVREEPVRTKYKSAPTPLSIPVGSQPLPIAEDGHAVGKTKIERSRRGDRPPLAGDPNSSGRRSPWNRASDICSSPSSPTTSLSSHHTTSPTMPLYPDLAGYPTSPATTSATFTPSIISPVPIPETSYPAQLPDPSGGYFSVSPPFQSPPSSVIPVPSQAPAWTPMSKATGTKRHSQELPHHMQSLSAMSSKYRLDTIPDPRPKNTQKVKDAGDVPFIFSPELEAATAAKLKAALSTTPVMGSFSALMVGQYAEDAYGSSQAPPASPSSLGLGYSAVPDTSFAVVNGVPAADGNHPRFVNTTSSSLQGWAG